MATVTALRERHGLVAIELDGGPWRTVPVVAAAEARLTVGCSLDRERARALGRALRRHRARDAAVRAVARRDHSRATLDARLERAGVRETERVETIEAAARAGLVDDARFAEARAQQLASRGAGDLLVARRPRAERRRRRHGPRQPLPRSSPRLFARHGSWHHEA